MQMRVIETAHWKDLYRHTRILVTLVMGGSDRYNITAINRKIADIYKGDFNDQTRNNTTNRRNQT